jgi:hypothetical protein
MAKCVECGVAVGAGEHFCGACGTQQPVPTVASAKVANLEMGEDHEQETLDSVDVPKLEKQTGELSTAVAAD